MFSLIFKIYNSNSVRLTSLILMYSFLLYSCREQKPNSEGKKPKVEFAAIAVHVSISEKRPFSYTIRTTGKVRALNEAQVICKTSGWLSDINVRNGDWIEAGQLIAQLENDNEKLNLEKAKIQLEEKKVEYQDLAMGFAKDSVRNKIQLSNIYYSSGLATSVINYKQEKAKLEFTKIISPISGVVTGLSKRKFTTISSTEIFCTVYDNRNLIVECFALEEELLLLKKGQPVQLHTLSNRKIILEGSVDEIDPRIDLTTGMAFITIKLGKSNQLVPGMNVEALIHVPKETSLLVPKEAIVLKSGKEVVFTYKDGRAKWNFVITGRENGTDVEINEGLQEGEQVIISNNLQLAHDSQVTIVKD